MERSPVACSVSPQKLAKRLSLLPLFFLFAFTLVLTSLAPSLYSATKG
jgi:hypothetical protein